jgi:catechol 2,3-dioxygenase-like lactoylglutathione lyase family enzyme
VFSHIFVGSNDLERSKAFYDALLATLDIPPARMGVGRFTYATPTGNFLVATPINGEPATVANGGTIGFACSSAEQVDAWHDAGVAAGGTSIEDPPGVRAGSGLYLAYLRDPDGNKLCALYRMG